jgi:hypothetical protein
MHALNFEDPKGIKLQLGKDDLWGVSGVPEPEITKLLFRPKAFVVEHPKLDGKIIEASAQIESLRAWSENPKRPVTYICSGNPDDTKARYFAMCLAALHKKRIMEQGKRPNIVWEQMYGGFENPAMRMTDDPTLLVIDNLSAIPNRVKYDKTRDLIARWAHVPKVLVVSGEDPVSFAAGRLFKAVHALAYFPSKLAKNAQTII